MSSTLFIADLHLERARPTVTRALAEFLPQHNNCDRLYILGDLFDAWIGDDDDSPLVTEVAAILRKFSAAGPELFIMQGNRDFLLGNTFCQIVGARLLPDPTVIDLYGEPTLLMHGDSLCTGDKEYQAFRTTARDPRWQAQLLALELPERRALAARMRSESREATGNKAEDIMDVSPSEVEKVMRDCGVKQLIHGHTHRPAEHQSGIGRRWVLGDWDSRGWAITASPNNIKLNNFNIIQ
ncbi:MAG: UDP-2,3-diacylglucosamine diphosphatase [Gammaproteobacteria bacterium]|nr:MAG: UDP-2,3-diacylglucosamine diphosphatase [Gammaproteobacteria bacterium]RLA59125.1 MAG: UDP-2,3-diacylglucosamine diphosphatase [Gammaproteobacteria bacterium]HDY82865.1 UDP-2,3-diacylglucosamine diphosphatase [Halieaceae bacterium]